MNEWEFTGDVSSWINELLPRFPESPFVRAKVEQTGTGSRRRRDITIIGRHKAVLLTGELKLPDRDQGSTPYNAQVVRDAHRKAVRAGAAFFFTWNVNECVLWETANQVAGGWSFHSYRSWQVTSIRRSDDLTSLSVISDIQRFLPIFLTEAARAIAGDVALGRQSPDQHFIDVLESALRLPIELNKEELEQSYGRARFKAALDDWMRDEQGWTILDDDAGVREMLERAAKFACYNLMNKLVFHEALLRRYGTELAKLSVPDHIDDAEGLRLHLEGYFAEARRITGDYETVFGEDHRSIGSRIPFYSNGAVKHWRELIDQIHQFDFSKLDYEVIGQIFERLIGPEERHKYGQYYTRVEVVDLINSFCIQAGTETVIDPACGGGTFLVRAYARKRELDPARPHRLLLRDLYGIDRSQFAAHLTSINLATRDLIEDDNYPQIAREDFFDVIEGRPFLTLPMHKRGRRGVVSKEVIAIPKVDAVVGNPPYVRQEEIPTGPAGRRTPPKGTKAYYQSRVTREAGVELSGRSDLHCYFWPHSSSFLKPNGYLCFLTSSQWLDIDYGFDLQEWILKNFEVVAILESAEEPWFVGARVATTVTILRKQANKHLRDSNTTRFLQLRRPIAEIMAHDGTTGGAIAAADTFRDEVLGLRTNTANDRYRARVVAQGELWKEGVRVGALLRRDKLGSPRHEVSEYYGSKWGIHVRAPDVWFEIQEHCADRLVPLAELGDVRFGVKTGRDNYFYPRDVSEPALSEVSDSSEFAARFGAPRKLVENGTVAIVKCGDGYSETRPLERKYLEPEIHSLMEINSYVASAEQCTRLVLLAPSPRSKLKNTYADKYIAWGERTGVHRVQTVSGRATAEREWFDLTDAPRCNIVLPKIQQYRLISCLNPDRFYQNSSLLGIYDVPADTVLPLCAALNSTVSILARILYARGLGNEGAIQLDVYLAKMMPTPDYRKFRGPALKRAVDAFRKMSRRPVLSFLSERRLREMSLREKGQEHILETLSDESELDQPDRHALDSAFLELLGFSNARHRAEVLERLYQHMRVHFEIARRKEEAAIQNRRSSRQRGPATPAAIAEQLLSEIKAVHADLLRPYDPFFLDRDKPFDTVDVPVLGDPEVHSTLFAPHGVAFRRGARVMGAIELRSACQVELVQLLASDGVRGLVRIPRDDRECKAVLQRYKAFVHTKNGRITSLIGDRTADEEMQERVRAALLLILQG